MSAGRLAGKPKELGKQEAVAAQEQGIVAVHPAQGSTAAQWEQEIAVTPQQRGKRLLEHRN